ncbi:hypothetical protein IAU59_001252 [Kwoniella sp. CBS 9459]
MIHQARLGLRTRRPTWKLSFGIRRPATCARNLHTARPILRLPVTTWTAGAASVRTLRIHDLQAQATAKSCPQANRAFHTTRSTRGSSVSPFKLHDIGEGITEVEVLRWYVTEGQEVAEFDALCEVQSDKSVVELTSHATGTVRGIKFEAGKMVRVGQVLCEIHTEAEGQDEGEMESAAAEEKIQGPLDLSSSPGEREPAAKGEGKTVVNREATVQSAQSEAVSQAEDLSEALEKNEEQLYTEGPSLRVGKRHPLADKEDGEQDQDALHHELFNSRDASADLAGPTQLVGEASILPTPPSSRLRNHQAPQHVEPRRERTLSHDDTNGNARKTIVKASPAIRTLAARLGVDLADVKASGPSGRITKDDIEAMAPRASAGAEAGTREPGTRGGAASAARESEPEFRRIEFGRTRKVMYRALGGQGTIPHFGYAHTLNLTPLLPYLKASNNDTSRPSHSKPNYIASDIPHDLVRDPLYQSIGTSVSGQQEGKTTILTFLVKALILALEEHPIMRARVKEASQGEGHGSGERWLEVNRDPVLGVAVSDPKHGLLTPSLPPLSPSTSLSTITGLLHSLRHAPNRPSTPANLTISSVGGLGEARGAMPVLPPGGGLAICAVGRAAWEMEWVARNGLKSQNGADGVGKGKSVWELDAPSVEKAGTRAVLKAPVGWSGDHRVLEGAELIAFTETWKKYIEEPWRWLKVDG